MALNIRDNQLNNSNTLGSWPSLSVWLCSWLYFLLSHWWNTDSHGSNLSDLAPCYRCQL